MDPADLPETEHPLDALAFVEVLGQRRDQLTSQMRATHDMLRPYALRALLDGYAPEEVGRLCGFDFDRKAPEVDTHDDLMTRYMRQMMYGPQQPTERERFEAWLNDYVDELVAGDHAR